MSIINNNLNSSNNAPFAIHHLNSNNNNNFYIDNINNGNISVGKISIVHQNVGSLRENFKFLVSHISAFPILPSLIFISEIWIYDYEADNYNMKNYTFHTKCNNNYRAGGVGVYVHDSIEQFSILTHCFDSADCLQIDATFSGEPFSFICFYRFHFKTVTSFISELKIFLTSVKSKNLILIGDFNIDILSDTSLSYEYLSTMAAFGLESLINSYTRIHNQSNSCIDHIFSRSSCNKKSFTFLPRAIKLDISDHHCLFLDIIIENCCRTIPDQKTTYYKKIDFIKLNDCLLIENWNEVYNKTDPSIAYDTFFQILSNKIEECSCSELSSHTKFLQPWMNKGLYLLIKKKHKISLKLARFPHNKKLFKYHNKISKKVAILVEETKNNYYTREFETHSGNIRAQWVIVDKILNKYKKSTLINEIITESGNINNPNRIAQEFNNHFLNIPRKTIENCAQVDYNCRSNIHFLYHPSHTSSNFFFYPVSADEVTKCIVDLKNKYSLGSDGISTFIVKKIFVCFVEVLVYIFNLSFQTGIFPDKLKEAVVVPLYKKDDKRDLNNYRPISLLPIFSKVFEKIVKFRLINYLDKIQFLSNNQYGFRKKRSTEDALLSHFNRVYQSLNNGEKTAGLYIDITKAFDTVNHRLLLSKLENIGIRGIALKWFQSYLKNRVQQVKVNGKFSDVGTFNIGVPQGSVLGPLLFLVYINSIFSCGLIGNMVAFADDMALFYSEISQSGVENKIRSDLLTVRHWFDCHSMVMSSKTKVMFFDPTKEIVPLSNITYHDSRCQSDICSHINCFQIENVHTFRYLGLNVDHNLNWKVHVAIVSRSLLISIRKMYLLRRHCSPYILRIFYFAFIHSRIQYGISCWGGIYISNIHNVIVSQKHAVRVIYSRHRLEHSFPLFIKAKILPVRNLFVFKVLKLFYIRSGNYSIRNNPRYDMRIQGRFNTIRAHKEFCRRSFSYIAPFLYNKLPLEIKNIEILKGFLIALKTWLQDNESVESLLSVES